MPDKSIRIAVLVVAVGILAACGIGDLVAKRSATAPIVITDPGSAPPPPISGPANSTVAGSDATAVATGQATNSSPVPTAAAGQTSSSATEIAVDVAGAVRNPTVYELPPGSRVQQAIHAAGGPTADADLDQVNLAEKLTDSEKIYIPRKGSDASTQPEASSAGNALGLIPVPPVPPLPYSTEQSPDASPAADTGSHSHGSNKLTSPADGQIDLNTATAEDLERVPDVGPAMAARILAYRQQSGGFQSVAELRQVQGIGDKKFARMSPFFVVR